MTPCPLQASFLRLSHLCCDMTSPRRSRQGIIIKEKKNKYEKEGSPSRNASKAVIGEPDYLGSRLYHLNSLLHCHFLLLGNSLLSVAMIVVKDQGSRTRIKDYKGSTKRFLNRSRIKSLTICSLFDQLQFHRFAKMSCF